MIARVGCVNVVDNERHVLLQCPLLSLVAARLCIAKFPNIHAQPQLMSQPAHLLVWYTFLKKFCVYSLQDGFVNMVVGSLGMETHCTSLFHPIYLHYSWLDRFHLCKPLYYGTWAILLYTWMHYSLVLFSKFLVLCSRWSAVSFPGTPMKLKPFCSRVCITTWPPATPSLPTQSNTMLSCNQRCITYGWVAKVVTAINIKYMITGELFQPGNLQTIFVARHNNQYE